MKALPLPVSNKRTLDEEPSDQRDFVKRTRLYDELDNSSPGETSYEKILDELPPVTSRVERYCGIDKTRHSALPHTVSKQVVFRALYLTLLVGEIRLLKLYAGEKDEPLRAALVHTPLSAVVDRYEALSYVWGSSAASETITIKHRNGETETSATEIAIQPNLYAALRQLRQQDKNVVVWADALCINQENLKERSEQVRRTADIYRSAKNVIVWLGESSMQSRAAMRTISAMLTPGFFSQTPQHDWSVVYALLQNEWFSRRWVVQEIVSAKDATLMVGEDAMDWRDFADAVELFETNLVDISQLLRTRTIRHKYDTDPLGSLNHSGALELMRTVRELKPSAGGRGDTPCRTLEWLLTSLKAFQTADPRDTIYALLAIASDGDSITPDYEKTLLEVLMDVMTHVIDQSSSLDILLRYWFPVSQEGYATRNPPLSNFGSKATTNSNHSSSDIVIYEPTQSKGPSISTHQTPKKLRSSGSRINTYGVFSKFRLSSSISCDVVGQVTNLLLDSGILQKWDDIPKWIKRVDGLPFGDPQARSTRRINGNPLVSLPGDGHYNATKGKNAHVRWGQSRDSSIAYGACSVLHTVDSTTENPYYSNGILFVQGVELGVIADLSARMADGIALQECLEMGGFSLRQATAGQNVPDRLWRTLVAGIGSNGRPATTITRLAFVNLANKISEHRSIDPGELLTAKLDVYIHQFVARLEEVVWNRRIFKGTPWNRSGTTLSQNDELFGLAPQQARMGDKICLLYGCSVPVVLRECQGGVSRLCWLDQKTRSFYEIIGEAYVDGFMNGEAFEGEYGQNIEAQAREFALL